MNSPQVGPSNIPFLDRWPPAPHHRLTSASANAARLHLSDGPHANDPRCPVDDPFFRPRSQHAPPSQSTTNWRPTAATLFSPPSQSYQPLLAELEPYGVPQYYPPSTGATGSGDYDEDDSFDISALADQYLDLSQHCPLPTIESRSVSPCTDYTDGSEVLDVDFRAAKRRRTEDWQFLSLPKGSGSDDGYSEESRDQERPCRSPFYHSPSPSHELLPIVDVPRPKHTGSKHTHTTHLHGPPALKFTEARKDGRSKRQALACLFCRERKIACGRPSEKSKDRTCNQCVRRHRECVYPTESRRGQHSRIKSLARRAQAAHNLGVGMMLPLLNS